MNIYNNQPIYFALVFFSQLLLPCQGVTAKNFNMIDVDINIENASVDDLNKDCYINIANNSQKYLVIDRKFLQNIRCEFSKHDNQVIDFEYKPQKQSDLNSGIIILRPGITANIKIGTLSFINHLTKKRESHFVRVCL